MIEICILYYVWKSLHIPTYIRFFILCRPVGVGDAMATHSANFDEKVHKPQSKSYGRIGANMQLIFTHILWIWILLSVHHNFLESEGLQGTYIDALNSFSSKLMTFTLRGGLWTFLANLALCVPHQPEPQILFQNKEPTAGLIRRTLGIAVTLPNPSCT